MVTQSTDIEMKEDLEFSDAKEEAAYWRQMAEEYAQKRVPLFLLCTIRHCCNGLSCLSLYWPNVRLPYTKICVCPAATVFLTCTVITYNQHRK